VCLARGHQLLVDRENFDRWAERVDFEFGMDNSAALRSRAEALDESSWTALHRSPRYQSRTGQEREREPNHKQRIVAERDYLNIDLNHEDVAEFDYQPGKCARPYRGIALRRT
jgi:hypothetical protein